MTARQFRMVVGLLCLAGGMAFICAEAALRILAAARVPVGLNVRRFDPAAVQIVPIGDVGFRQKPGARFSYANGTSAVTNALGYRGPVVAVPKPQGMFRILLLGGSTIHGWYVNENETIDTYVRQLLHERRPDVPTEVVNLAFDGYDSYQLRLRLHEEGWRYQPDLIVVAAGNVDVANARYEHLRDGDPRTLIWGAEVERLRAEQARGRPTLWNMVKHWSYVARLPQFVRDMMYNRSAQPADGAAGAPTQQKPAPAAPAAPVKHEAIYWDAADYFERNLTQLVQEAAAHHAAVLFVTEPTSRARLESMVTFQRRYYLQDAATTQSYRDTLAARMQGLGTRMAHSGAGVAYLRIDSLPPDSFLDDAHLKPAGNRLVAERIANFVTSILPPKRP